MPETSIVIKAHDRYSDAMKAMKDASKAFGKDLDGLQDKLDALNKTRATLKVDTDKARAELKEAEKAFAKTGDAADELDMIQKRLNFENARRNLELVSKEAKATEKQMLKTGNAISKTENTSLKKTKISELAVAMAAGGVGDMVSELALNAGVGWIGSMGGSTAGTMASSILSSAVSGAAAGSLFGPLGSLIGAAAGGVVGAGSGALQNYNSRDEAFKNYVQEAAEDQLSQQESTLSSGSSIAGSREQTFMAFSQRLGSDEAAREYLTQVQEMAKQTNYDYDEITGYSKLLLNTYGTDKTLSVLQTLSDASAGLNLGSSDVEMFISGLSRMRTTGKTTQEYLNYFSERGVDVYQALANATGADKSNIADMVTDGKIGGADAAEAILTYIDETYGGLSDKLAGTYDAMVDNLADYQADMDAAMGEGYNEGRKAGIQAEMDWMSGETGEALEEANRAIGAWKAELENSKEQYIRDAMDAMMASEEYQTAQAEGNAAEMGKLIMQAKVQGMNEYNASEGAQLALEAELALADGIRDDSASNEAYWNAGYVKGKEFTKGLSEALHLPTLKTALGMYNQIQAYNNANGYATGIDYVPYDNFPALLHQGERVQTAVEARSGRGGGSVTVTGNTFVIREEADVGRVAAELLERMELAEMRG